MKQKALRLLSLLLVLGMLLDVILIPGILPVVNAVEESTTPSIPTATTAPTNIDFETMVGGEVDTSDFTFSVGSTNKAEVRTDGEHYLYLEKNASENPVISRDLTEVVDSQYVLISVDLASTAWSGAVMKLTGTTATHTVFVVDANGVISAGSNSNGGTIPADGTFATVTVAVNSSSNKYSVWVGETQIALDAALPSSFGNVTNMSIEMAGDVTGSNLMVDNVKVSSYLPVFYNNDFNTNASGVSLLGATNGIAAREVDSETANGYIHLKRATGDAGYVRLLWNYGGNLGACKQAVYSFKVSVVTDYELFFLVNTGAGDSTVMKFNSSDNYFKAYADNNGPNSTTSSTTLKNITSYTPGSGYIQIDMVLDGVNDTLSVYANGNKTATYNVGFLGTITSLGCLTLRTHTIGSEMYLDDIAVYAGTEPRDIDPTQIPAVDKVYIDNSFEKAASDGYMDLTGFVLAANNEANKAVAPKINHYLYIMQNSTSNRPVVNLDLTDYVDSHYIVASMDIASTTGGAPFYVSMVDTNGNETISLLRIGSGHQNNDVNGKIMIGSSDLSPSKSLPLDGTYHTFTLVIDTEADTFSLWMDGQSCVWISTHSVVSPLNKTGGSTFDFSKMAKLKFSTGWISSTSSTKTDHAVMMVDNIQVYSYEEQENPDSTESTEATTGETTGSTDSTDPDPNDPTGSTGLNTPDPTQTTGSTDPGEPTGGTENPEETGKVYYNNDFSENHTGIVLTPGTDSVAKHENGAIHLGNNGTTEQTLLKFTPPYTIDCDNLVISMDISSTSFADTRVYLNGQNVLNKLTARVGTDKQLMANTAPLRKYVPSDGTTVNVAITIDSVNNTYSVWLNGVLCRHMNEAARPASFSLDDGFGRLRSFYVKLMGGTENANLTIDNLKVYEGTAPRTNVGDVNIAPVVPDPSDPTQPTESQNPTESTEPSVPSDVGNEVYYNNDFSENIENVVLVAADNTAQYNKEKAYIYLSRSVSGQPRAIWNYDEVVELSDYVVFSVDLSTTSLGRSRFTITGRTSAGTKDVALFEIQPEGRINFWGNGAFALKDDPIISMGKDKAPARIDIAVNVKNGTYSAWINGVKKFSNATFISDVASFGKLVGCKWHVHDSIDASGATVTTDLIIDNLRIYDGVAPKDNVGNVTVKPKPTNPPVTIDPSEIGNKVYCNSDFSEKTDGISFAPNQNIAQYKDGALYMERSKSGQPSAYWNKDKKGNAVFPLSDFVVISAELSSTSLGESYMHFTDESDTTYGLFRIEPNGQIRFYKRDNSNKVAFTSTIGKIPSDGTPIKVDVFFNTRDGRYTLWIDGNMLVNDEQIVLPEKAANLKYVRWYVHNSLDPNGVSRPANLIVDNLKVYDGIEPKDNVGPQTEEIWRPDTGTALFYENDFETGKKSELTLKGSTDIVADDSGNHYLNMIPGDWFLWNYSQKWDLTPYIMFEVDVASTDHGTVLIQFTSENSYSMRGFVMRGNGEAMTPASSTAQKKLDEGGWVNVAIGFNAVENTYSVWYDKVLVLEDATLWKEPDELSSIRFDLTSGGYTSYVKFDNIKIYSGLTPDDYSKTSQITEQVQDESYLDEVFGKPSEMLDYATEALAIIDAAHAVMVNTDTLYIYRNGQRVQGTKAEVDALLKEAEGKTIYKNDIGLVIVSAAPVELTDQQVASLHKYMVFTRPLGADLKAAFATASSGDHPRIILNQTKLDKLRADYKSNEYIKKWGKNVIAQADRMAKSKHLPSSSQGAETGRTLRDRAIYLSLAYLLTGDAKYKDFLWGDLEIVSKYMSWSHTQSYLTTADFAQGVAIAYDWLYDEWTPEQRKLMEEGAYKNAFFYHHKYMYGALKSGLDTFVRSETNRNGVTNGGIGLLAMAMFEAYPDKCADMLEKTYHFLEYMMVEFAPAGANLEGPAYWEYQMRYLLPFIVSSQLTFGSDYNISKAPGFDRTGDFYLDIDGMDGVNNLHDAVEANKAACGELFGLSNIFNNPGLTQAVLSKMSQYNIAGDVFSVLYYDTSIKATASIDKPFDAYYERLELFTMRSSWLNKAGIYVSAHSGDNNIGSHTHIDCGSFVMDIGGQRFAGDYGKESYDLRATGQYRYYYYRIRPEGHNLFVINPDKTGEDAGQNFYANEVISEFVSKDRGAYAIMSLDSAYKDYAQSATRGIMLGDDRNSVLIRDEIRGMTNAENEVWWFMQMPHVEAEISDDGKSAILRKNGVEVRMQVLTDAKDYEIKIMDTKEMYPKPNLVDQDKQTTNTGWSRLAIVFKTGKDVNISVKFAELEHPKGDTPIKDIALANWSIEDGVRAETPTLYSIKIGEQELPDFSPYLTFYNFGLPFGSTECPEVTVTGGEGCDIKITKPKRLPGYLRITVTNKKDDTLQTIYKIMLTVNGAITVDAPVFESDNPPRNMLDGNLSTRYAANGAAAATFTFATPKEVDAMWICSWQMAERWIEFTIDVSEDGETFKEVGTYKSTMLNSGENDRFQEFKIPKGTYKSIRINVNGSEYPDGRDYSWCSIWEVMFYVDGAPVKLDVAPGQENNNQGGNSSNPNEFFPDINPTEPQPTDPSVPDIAEPNDGDKDKGKNQGGMIALIVGLSLAVVAAGAAVAIILIRRKKRAKSEAVPE